MESDSDHRQQEMYSSAPTRCFMCTGTPTQKDAMQNDNSAAMPTAIKNTDGSGLGEAPKQPNEKNVKDKMKVHK